MDSEIFKNKLSEIRGFLKGKEIILQINDGKTKSKIEVYSSLKEFGLKFLKLHQEGAGFHFSIIANDYVEKVIDRRKPIEYYTKHGVWTKIKIAVTLK